MAESLLTRLKESFWFRFLRNTDWYGLPPDARAEMQSKGREIDFWANRALTEDNDWLWWRYAYYPRFVGYSNTIVEAIANLRNLKPSFSLHEFGCNLGRNCYYAWKRFPNVRVSGNDVSPYVRDKCREYYGDFADKLTIEIESTQEWLERAIREGRKIGVCFTSDHLVHFPDDSVELLVHSIPKVVRHYLILKESFGVHKPTSRWYRHWTTHSGTHWFDRDYAKVFANSSLTLIEKRKLCQHPGRKVCALYVFEQKGR